MQNHNKKRGQKIPENKPVNYKSNRKKKGNKDQDDENFLEANFNNPDSFLSHRNNEVHYNSHIQFKREENPIYSPKRPEKNNPLENAEVYSLRNGRNIPRRNTKSNKLKEDLIIQLEGSDYLSPNKRAKSRKHVKEVNTQDKKNNKKKDSPQQAQDKNQNFQKAKSRRGRKPKQYNLDKNEFKDIINEKKEDNDKRRNTRSSTTRFQKEKKEKMNLREENNVKNKESDIVTVKNKKRGRKEKSKMEIEENERGYESDNYSRNYRSKSPVSNSVTDKNEKNAEITNFESERKRNCSSPRLLYKNKNEQPNNNRKKKETDNNINYFSSQRKNKKSGINLLKILENCILTLQDIDRKNFTIILNKININPKEPIVNKKNIFKVNKPEKEENYLGKKRGRNKSKKENGKDNNKINQSSYKHKKTKKNEIDQKKNKKGKSQYIPADIRKNFPSDITEQVNKLKKNLNCDNSDKDKTAPMKGKQKTRKNMSVKRRRNLAEKIKKEEINSLDSFSEPDKNVYDYNNNNNCKVRSPKNLNNNQFQYENSQPNFIYKKNNLKSSSAGNTCTNTNNNMNNSYILYNNNGMIMSNKAFWLNNDFPCNNNNDIQNYNYNLSSSCKEFGSDTPNFIETSNNFEFSFPIDFEEKIDIKEDKTYFAKNSKYIKYHPVDKYLDPISNEDKKPYTAKISIPHTKKINFSKKKENIKNNQMDSDNDITDLTSSNNDYNNDLPSILTIPRIKPFKEEHSKMIKDKLNQEGIKIYQTDTEFLLKEEKSIYAGSFVLYDDKNNIKVTVPCFKDNSRTLEFMNKKRVTVIEFQEDNDIDTDDEQLELEIQRNNNALLNFMKKVNKTKNYVEKNLVRKKKK